MVQWQVYALAVFVWALQVAASGQEGVPDVLSSYTVSQELAQLSAQQLGERLRQLVDFEGRIHINPRDIQRLVQSGTPNGALKDALTAGATVDCFTLAKLADLPTPRVSDLLMYLQSQGVDVKAARSLLRCTTRGCTGRSRSEIRETRRQLAILGLGADINQYKNFLTSYNSEPNIVPQKSPRRPRPSPSPSPTPRRSKRQKARQGMTKRSVVLIPKEECVCARATGSSGTTGRKLMQVEEFCELDALDGFMECMQSGERLPPVVIPVVFHVFGFYKDGVALPPRANTNAPFRSLITQVNFVFQQSGSNIRFRIQEVRRFTNPAYTYLRMDSVESYQMQYNIVKLLPVSTAHDVDRLRIFNIYIVGDARLPVMPGEVTEAYAFQTRPNIEEFRQGFPIVLNYDNVDPSGSNSIQQFNSGARTLAHELCHACGLYHIFTGGCEADGDCVADTPRCSGSVFEQEFASEVAKFCGQEDLDAEEIPQRFDSCTDQPGQDPVINLMHYTFPQCRRRLTPGQVRRMECVLRQWRPTMVEANAQAGLPVIDPPTFEYLYEEAPAPKPFVFAEFLDDY